MSVPEAPLPPSTPSSGVPDPIVTITAYLDSNVLISASLAKDHKFLEFWRMHRVTPAASMYAIGEVRRNLWLPAQHLRFDQLLAKTQMVADANQRIIPDGIDLPPKDRPILAAAIAAKVHFLVTGDRKHFATLYGRRIAGVEVISPADFLDRNAYRLML
jgi:predicted nucleic acid-binding protein